LKNWSLLSVKVDPSSRPCRFVGDRKEVEQASISAILAKKIQRFPWEIAESVAQFSHISYTLAPAALAPSKEPRGNARVRRFLSLTGRPFFRTLLTMTSIPVTKARSQLYQLLDAAARSHEPIQITGKRANAVLVSEEDWRSIQETLYLMAIPGMRNSIRKGMAEPLKKALKKPGW
jgi:antitoxin YefM